MMDAELSNQVVENLLDQIDDLKLKSGAMPGILEGATYYSCPGIPNPRVVDYFAAEVGVLDKLHKIMRTVDVFGNENRNEEILALNPDGAVPFLKLADGTVVAETIAIAEMIEMSGIGKAKLYGDTTPEKGVVHMWQRRVELHITNNAYEFFRSGPARDFFKERGMHGYLHPETAEAKKDATKKGLKWLEDIVSKSRSDWICLNKITIVDVHLYVTLNFIMTFAAFGAPPFPDALDGLPWLSAWYSRMGARPAAAASVPSQ